MCFSQIVDKTNDSLPLVYDTEAHVRGIVPVPSPPQDAAERCDLQSVFPGGSHGDPLTPSVISASQPPETSINSPPAEA